MKVVYYSKDFFSDCDFPLIKALLEEGVDVRYYLALPRNFQRGSLIELEKPARYARFTKASKISGFHKYSSYIDLDKLYLIYGYHSCKISPLSWLVWIYAVFHMLLQRPDIIHLTWPLGRGFERLILCMPWHARKIVTVHDPIPHSGNNGSTLEEIRRRTFKWADELVLLNTKQTDVFCKAYGIPKSQIKYSSLGVYDGMLNVNFNGEYELPQGKYILFFGYISKYKGLEYLLEAMRIVHYICDDLKLIVAGGGDLYFNSMPYRNLDYIEWRNRYIGNGELSSLLKGCEFVVCPYTDATQSGVIQTALSFSVPVVASNVGALAESIEDGEIGLLLPPCDKGSIANAIIELHTNPDLLDKMRYNIEYRWLPKNSWKPIAKQYIEIYKKGIK